jgi:xanthine dehydrogenase accessory factor
MALESGKTIHREFQLDDDFGWDDGLICGGRVQVLLIPESSRYEEAFRSAAEGRVGAVVFDVQTGLATWQTNGVAQLAIERRRPVLRDGMFAEPFLHAHRLFIFGAGHVGAAIGELAAAVGFDVTVIDDRRELLSGDSTSWAAHRVVADPQRFAVDLETQPDDFVCLVTRGHRNDSKVLRELINKPLAYLGMIGSKRKRIVVQKQLAAEGICAAEEFERVYCPMGIDIGAETVEEIAFSIVAELIQVRAERRGPSLARCSQAADALPTGTK